MHAWLAFIAGVLVVVGAILIFAAAYGIAYYGLNLEAEEVLAIIFFVIATIAGWLSYTGLRAQYRRVKTGKEALIGAKGVAVTDLKPNGEVRVLGEFWQATTKNGAITAGQPVIIIGMEGMFLIVKSVNEKA